MLQLEILANELLLDIFEYLSTAQLTHAFFGLNYRFHQLLHTHFRNYGFNFQSITKQNFDIVCEQHLPVLADDIISLHLSNDDETPKLCELFFSNGFTFDKFNHLKSLSLYQIDPSDTIIKIIRQCRYLLHLNRLKLINCHANQWSEDTTVNIINIIWSFPKLTHCTINDCTITNTCLSKISVISLSIKYLSMKSVKADINILHCLFEIIPHLERLKLKMISHALHDQYNSIWLSLISLETFFISYDCSLIDVLQYMPNLCYLTLEISKIMNGHDWEKLIVNYLPKLKVFRLKMTFKFSNNDNIDELLDSFRTDFWIEQHQWYVRCDCYHSNYGEVGTLYTLPCTFYQYSYSNPHYSKSTKPDDEEICCWNNVQYTEQRNITIDSFNDLSLLNARFPNIIHFKITFPLTDYFGSHTLSFNRLRSLTVILNSFMDYKHLQMLLDGTHNLYSLKLDSFGGSPEGLFQLRSSSVRRLDLMKAQLIHGSFFNNEDCMNLINSPLGRQCEVLSIEIENRTDILNLIEQISHLRALNFRCKDVIWNYSRSSSIDRKFNRWLKENLSSKSSIVRDENNRSKISVWIYRTTNESPSTNDSDLTFRDRKTLASRFFKTIRQFFSSSE